MAQRAKASEVQTRVNGALTASITKLLAPQYLMDCCIPISDVASQRHLNAAARLVSDMRKFDRGLSQLMHVDLHWLDVPE